MSNNARWHLARMRELLTRRVADPDPPRVSRRALLAAELELARRHPEAAAARARLLALLRGEAP